MEIASSQNNIAYVHQDFKSLMGNMYMLEKKLDALVPLATSGKKQGFPLNDPVHIYARLLDLQTALDAQNLEAAGEAMEDLARSSFDHDLDLLLNEVRWAVEEHDFEGARARILDAIAYYKGSEAMRRLAVN